MKKVTVAGFTYLGDLKKNKDGSFVLNNSLQISCGVVNKDSFMEYLKAKNEGELSPIDFGGQGNAYTVSPLTKGQKLDLKVCKLTMKRAKALQAPQAENEVFEELLGK